MTLRLDVIEGPTRGQTHSITGITVIGREAASCGVVIPEPTVSRTHAVVRPDESGPGYIIEDLDSRSGTYVNGVRKRRAVLLEGDRVKIGSALLRVHLREDAISAGRIEAGELEEASQGGPPRRPTLKLDATSFRTTAKDLDPRPQGTSSGVIPVAASPPAPVPPPETAAERLEAIIELSHTLAATHDRNRLVQEVLRHIFSLLPQAKRVGYFDVEAGSERPQIAARLLVDREARGGVTGKSAKVSKTIVEEAVSKRLAILSDDLSRDARFSGSQSASEFGARSVLCAPLCAGDQVLGALYCETGVGARPFDEGALRFLAGIASVVASAAENVRLLQNIQAETARRAVLERYFAPDMLERILRGEVPLARDGEVRRGTILFTDIRGFTHLTSTTEPKVLVTTLNAYFEAMQRIVFRSRGTVERFGGDSILAYWGVMDEDANGPLHATRAALHMQNELFRLDRELAMVGKPVLDMGIGVNTGDVIAGNVGSAERYEFTILGEAVNLARRIEDLAGPGEVLLGEATHAAIAREALVRMLPPREVKGRPAPVSLAALVGLRAEDSPSGARRWDLAVAGELGTAGARAVALEIGTSRATVEVLCPLGTTHPERVELSLRLPTGARARNVHGLTLELARPIVIVGHVDALGESQDTLTPIALQRVVQASEAGLDLVSVRLEEPDALLKALGVP